MPQKNLSKTGQKILKAMDETLNGDVIVYRYERDLPDIKELRAELGMDRDEFALAFNLSKYSVRNWELGVRHPHGAALALLQIIRSDPMQAYRMLHPEKYSHLT